MGTDERIAHVTPERMAEAIGAILTAVGASEANAKIVADNLVEADMAGRPSHGCRLVDIYAQKLLDGTTVGDASPEIVREDGCILRINGNRAFGQVVGEFAVGAGVDGARRHGLCLVTIENASHFGRNAKWPEMAARDGFLSIHFGHGFGAAPLVAPYNGSEPMLRTSPIAFGAPAADGNHVVLDFAVSEISMNTAKLASETGTRLPPGAAILRDGTPTDDPTTLLNGLASLVPFGGFKGYGIAVFAEILAAIVAGGDMRESGVNSMLSIYIDVARAGDLDSYNARLSELLSGLRSVAPVQGQARVSVPGDRSRMAREQHSLSGLPIGQSLRRSLAAAADRALVSEGVRSRWPELFASS